MTREEAKEVISRHHWAFVSMPDEVVEAVECLAEECEDAISRQAVIDSLYDWSNHSMTDAETWHLRQVIGDIKSMPSVTPKLKIDLDGMTNGEVIDLLFPNMDIYDNRDFTLREMVFPDEWWDEPYGGQKARAE